MKLQTQTLNDSLAQRRKQTRIVDGRAMTRRIIVCPRQPIFRVIVDRPENLGCIERDPKLCVIPGWKGAYGFLSLANIKIDRMVIGPVSGRVCVTGLIKGYVHPSLLAVASRSCDVVDELLDIFPATGRYERTAVLSLSAIRIRSTAFERVVFTHTLGNFPPPAGSIDVPSHRRAAAQKLIIDDAV